MRYLVSTTAKNGAAECEENLRRLGAIGPGDRVQAFPKKDFHGAYDLYLIESTDLQSRQQPKTKAKPKPKPKQPVRRAWFDNANLVTALIVAILVGILAKNYLLN